jgi:cytochrome c-type biogenesis protein CcmH/NrfG
MPVANVAHGAGAIVGGLAGRAFVATGRQRRVRGLSLASVVLLTALLCTLGRPFVKSRTVLAQESAYAGWKALDAGEWEQARLQLEQAVRAAPEDGRSWWCLGAALWQLERFEEASAAFDRSVALGERSQEELRFLAKARTYLASIAQQSGRLAEAEDLARRALEADPHSSDALNLQAYLREQAGAVGEAIELYERAASEGSSEEWAAQRLAALKSTEASR